MKDREDHPFWLEIYTEERIPAATFCLGSDGLLYAEKLRFRPLNADLLAALEPLAEQWGTGTQKWRRPGTYHEPSPPFAIVLSNLWIAYGFIQTVLERRPGDVHRLVRVVIEFQQVREQKGLCYSIYSYGTCHDNTGYFGVYTALGRETEGQALDTILAVIREPTEHGVTQAELDRAREQSKANVLMGLESAQSHMSSLGRGEVLDEDAIIAARPALWGGRLFCSHPAFPWGKVPRRGG
ncbi:MAG: insulinase family protein [Flavonifractor plautii]